MAPKRPSVARHLLGALQLPAYLFCLQEMHFQGRRVGIAVEEDVVAHVEPYVAHLSVGRHIIIIIEDASEHPRQDLDASPAVAEGHDGYHMVASALVLQLFALFAGAFVRDGDVPAKATVDVVHDLTEEAPVCRRVLQLVVADVVVYHLVDDDVLQLALRQVDTRVDAQAEVVELCPAEQGPALLVRTLPEERLRVAELHGNPGELAAEHQPVELPELLLDIRNRRFQSILVYAAAKLRLFR